MGCKCFSTRSELYNDINMDNLKDNSMINNNQEPQMISQFLSSKSDNQNIPNQKNKNSHNKNINSYNSRNKDSQFEVSSVHQGNTFADNSTKGFSNKTEKMKSFPEINQCETLRTQLLSEINKARSNPKRIIETLLKYKSNIHQVKNSFYLKADEKNNIRLYKGYKSFEDCESFLNYQIPLEPLKIKNELNLPFPHTSKANCDKEKYLTKELTKKAIEVEKNKLTIINFHYDISIGNPELSVLLQIVDDTNSKMQRRKNILSKKCKYIGITVGQLQEGLFCFYFVFGADL